MLLALAACDPSKPVDTGDPVVGPPERDNDGYAGDVDCDDGNAVIHPDDAAAQTNAMATEFFGVR